MSQNEKVIQTKICNHCFVSFEITDKDLEFYEKVSPVFGGKKYLLPSPTFCPDCRQKRRLSFRNERKLYKRKCDATLKNIISIYSPDKPYKVYDRSYWWSDNWDPIDYGRDFDFSRGFFEQFEELMGEVPLIGSQNKNSENCDYSNICLNSKDCYLSNVTHSSENIHYSSWVLRSNNCIDCLRCSDISNSYNCINSHNSNCVYYSILLNNCSNSYFSFDLINCDNCFLCFNLVNKQYCINNIEYSKENYFYELKNIYGFPNYNINGLLKNRDYVIKTNAIHKFNHNAFTENCEGDYLFESKNCKSCFDLIGAENCKYYREAGGPEEKNCFDCSYGGYGPELCYECMSAAGISNSFTVFCWNSNRILYSLYCYDSSNLFGCIGLRNKSYCILNKQYTKEQYEELVPKIIEHMMTTGEWGEFFPSSISPFGYNETVAMEYFPLGRDAAMQHLFKWSDYEPPFPKGEKIIPAKLLPENIADIPDDILNRAIECEITKKPFRIIKQELEFYRKHNLPIPKRHPDQRHLDRMSLRNPRKLFERKCDKCGKDIKTTYNPDRSEIVYCEECYNKEVY